MFTNGFQRDVKICFAVDGTIDHGKRSFSQLFNEHIAVG